MYTVVRILKVIFQIVTVIIPVVKGIIRILEQNDFKRKK